jgi:hypothetical protein
MYANCMHLRLDVCYDSASQEAVLSNFSASVYTRHSADCAKREDSGWN